MDYIKVQGHTNLVRDSQTNSIINTNMSEYEGYLARKKAKNQEVSKIENLEHDVDGIKNDLNEIKSLLRSLINGNETWWDYSR